MIIIDCHTHLNRYEEEDAPTLEERYRALRQQMDRHGIAYSLVLSSYKVNENRPSTDDILDVIGDDPRLGVVAGISYDNYSSADLAHIRVLLRQRRIKALKLYPGYEAFYVHDRRMRVVYELAAEYGVPVMIHTGDTYDPKGKVKYAHPLQVDDVAVDFPEVTFLICHLGNPWVTDAMEVIYKNENVVADISGFTLKHFEERFERYMLRQVREVIDYAGPRRKLLFGTDWPICEIGGYIRFVEKLELPPDEAEQIFWRNAVRVFNLDFEEETTQAMRGAAD